MIRFHIGNAFPVIEHPEADKSVVAGTTLKGSPIAADYQAPPLSIDISIYGGYFCLCDVVFVVVELCVHTEGRLPVLQAPSERSL